MGIYCMRDMAGLDVGWRSRMARAAERDPAERYAPLGDRLCKQGRFGQKTGAGYYRYDGRTASPDPEVEAMLADIAHEKRINRREFSNDEFDERILAAIFNDGARVLVEGVAQRDFAIDVSFVLGYGFEQSLGGRKF